MKMRYALGLTSLALLAFGLTAVSSASAEIAVWLVNGAKVNSSLPATKTEELLLEEVVGVVGTPMIFKCSATWESTVGPEGLGEVTNSLTLTGSVGFGCVKAPGSACEEATSNVSLISLPKIQLVLMEGGKILELLFREGGFGFLFTCLVLGSLIIIAECLATDAEIEVTNKTNGVEELGEQTPPYLCNRGAEGGEAKETGLISSLGSLTTTTEGTLATSTE